MTRSSSPQRFISVRLSDLLEWIAAGELALPDFQRDFDWDQKAVRAIVGTVLKNWPAGSLMFVEGSPPYFGEPRPFEFGPPVDRDVVRFLVLDGQQRLTALYRVLHTEVPPFGLRVADLERVDDPDPED